MICWLAPAQLYVARSDPDFFLPVDVGLNSILDRSNHGDAVYINLEINCYFYGGIIPYKRPAARKMINNINQFDSLRMDLPVFARCLINGYNDILHVIVTNITVECYGSAS